MKSPHRSPLSYLLPAACGFLFLALSAGEASAWPSYLNRWMALYPGSSSDTNAAGAGGQGCILCHVDPNGGSPWNPYGWEIKQRLAMLGDLDASILSAAAFDSEKNPQSWSNGIEIAHSTQPGWTAGPNNAEYSEFGVVTGTLPPSGILGSLDPAASPMVPTCDPGTEGVLACPCANPAGGFNRGCDNSSATLGAALTATGTASLANDTLRFATAGERANALSIVLQGGTGAATGVAYGQGVRCLAGPLYRMFQQSATAAGGIAVPAAGEPSVSERAAQLGDVIVAGSSRWYLVYYRDPVVQGACAPSSTFNATQTGRVGWQL